MKLLEIVQGAATSHSALATGFALAKRLRARGKPGSVIAATVANRWMRWLYYEMKTPQAA